MKPSLICLDVVKTISKSYTNDTFISKFKSNIGTNIISIIDSYKDLILLLSIFIIVLYFLYRFNKKNKNTKNNFEINFNRKVNFDEKNKVSKIYDEIENIKNIPNKIIDTVYDKIDDFEKSLQPIDINNLSNLSIL